MTKAAYPSGFDYGYRPASYFHHLDPSTLVVASILGEERRKDVQERLASGNFDPLVWGDWLTESKLDDSIRQLIGQAHPRFMGGEYLPQLGSDEIEIARIVLASVTQDVKSIRARRVGKRINYRIVDEYDSTFKMARKSSAKPLSLMELIELIDGSDQEGDEMAGGLVFSPIAWHIESTGEPEQMRDFVAVSSSFYPELESHYEVAIKRYLDAFLIDNEDEEETA